MLGKKLPIIGSMLPSSAAFLLKVPINDMLEIKLRYYIGNPTPFSYNSTQRSTNKNNKIDANPNAYLSYKFNL